MAAIARRDAGWTATRYAVLRRCSTKLALSDFTSYWTRHKNDGVGTRFAK